MKNMLSHNFSWRGHEYPALSFAASLLSKFPEERTYFFRNLFRRLVPIILASGSEVRLIGFVNPSHLKHSKLWEYHLEERICSHLQCGH